MKNNFRFFFVVFLLFSITYPLLTQWVQTNSPNNGAIKCFAVSGTNLFAGTRGGANCGVFLSTDNGTSWTRTLPFYDWVNTLAVHGTNLFAGNYSHGALLSANNGTSWTQILQPNAAVYSFAFSDTNVIVGTGGSSVYVSNASGTIWKMVGLPYAYVAALAFSGTNLFAGTYGGVFLSTNNGSNWTAVNSGLTTYGYDWTFVVSSNNVFAGNDGGVFLSTNIGTNWTQVNSDLTDTTVYALVASGTNLFVGTYGGVFLSTNNGTSWTSVGLTNDTVYALVVSGTNLFAGTRNALKGGVWRRPLSEMVTAVKDNQNEIPVRFSLSQNYPNPFNPSTTISFTLPSKSFVSLKVFDIIGREVATIVSQGMSAGSYTRQWDAANMSSGIYFYRLEASSYTQTKKLILLK